MGGGGLDIGAGTGLLTLELAPSFQHVTGFDVSTKMLDVMRAKLLDQKDLAGKVTPSIGPLEALGQFDLIFSLLAFHHIRDVESMVQRLRKHHLNPGGRLLIVDLGATPNVRRFHKPHEQVGEHYEHDGFKESVVRSLFADGFSNVDYIQRPLRKALHEDWESVAGTTPGSDEEYQLFFASAPKTMD